MKISKDKISDLRQKTGAGILDCKKALEESGEDEKKAIEFLRNKGAATSEKRSGKKTKEGIISTYSHGGRIASMVEVNCETDFVARSEEFISFAKDIAMQITAANPEYLSKEDVPKNIIEKEKEIELEKLKEEKKPKEILNNIIEGKLKKFYEEKCLLSQLYIKDPEIMISDLLSEKVAKLGEKIEIKRFLRYEVGK